MVLVLGIKTNLRNLFVWGSPPLLLLCSASVQTCVVLSLVTKDYIKDGSRICCYEKMI